MSKNRRNEFVHKFAMKAEDERKKPSRPFNKEWRRISSDASRVFGSVLENRAGRKVERDGN